MCRKTCGFKYFLKENGYTFLGAVALAAFHYVWCTEDVDLGVNADLPTLRAVADSFRFSSSSR